MRAAQESSLRRSFVLSYPKTDFSKNRFSQLFRAINLEINGLNFRLSKNSIQMMGRFENFK